MSPLPELESNGMLYSSGEDGLARLLAKDIGSNEHSDMVVWMGDKHELVNLFESIGVRFDMPLEDYDTGDKVHGFLFHKVFSTHTKGVYLELIFDNLKSYKNPESMLNNTEKNILHKYGEKLNQDYLDSITTG
jgi:hypothetical protein